MKLIDKLLFLYYLLPTTYIEIKLGLLFRSEGYFKYWIYFTLLYPVFLISKLFLNKNLLKLLILFNFISLISNYVFYYLIETRDSSEDIALFIKIMFPEQFFFWIGVLYFLFQCIIFYLFNEYVKKLIIKIKNYRS